MLCGTSTTLASLVFFRVVQGLFGGGLIATSQIVLRDTFEPERIGTSSALFAIALTVGPALGPTIGGFLTDQFSWPWVFDINVVPGVLAATIVFSRLRNPAPPRRLPFDAVGVALLAVALGSFQFVLDEGERSDWFDDPGIRGFAVASVAGAIGFVVWELRGTPHPIVDLRLFRYRNVRLGTAAAVLLGMVVFGPIVLLPQYVQSVLGFTATLSGLLIFMRALPVMFLTPLVARATARTDARVLLTIGFATSAASFAWLSTRMTTSSDFSSFVPALVVSGIGQAFLLVPLLVSVIGAVASEDGPKASSFISLCVQLGGSIASTLLVTAFDRRTFFHADTYRSVVRIGNAVAAPFFRSDDGKATLARIVMQQASNAGFSDAIALLVPVAVASLVPIWFLAVRRPKRSDPIPVGE